MCFPLPHPPPLLPSPDLFPSKHKALLFVEKHLHQRGQLACKQLAGDGLLLIKLQETAQQLGSLNGVFLLFKVRVP